MPGDLHCHTKLSDGTVGLEQLVELAKRTNLTAIAVTDHDTLAGTMRAKVIGERRGIRVLPGVELSCQDTERGRKVHLLCYLPDAPGRLEGLMRATREERKKAGQVMAKRVMLHFPVPASVIEAHVNGSTGIYKQHMMHALLDCGLADGIYGNTFDMLFGKQGTARVDKTYPDVREVLPLIKESGGIAVLAHPELYDSFDLLEELTGKGLDGVEVWHPRQTSEASDRLAGYARQHGLLQTGGSDFHGMYSSFPTPLGASVTPDEQLERFLAYKSRRKA